MVTLSLVTIEVPVAAVVTLIVTSVGGYGDAVRHVVNSYLAYRDIEDEYAIVKTYGKKN